jgi:predicted MFS family arabinose efflux permease
MRVGDLIDGSVVARMNYGKRDSLRPLVAGAMLYSIGPIAMLVMPMIVGGYVDELGFTGRQAGMLASTEATGICVASLLGIAWVRRLNWRAVTLSGLCCAVVANVLATVAHGFAPMLACRGLASLGTGTVFAAATASLGEQNKPETAFGIGLAVQTVLATAAMAVSAGIMDRWGVDGMFLLLALLGFVVAFPVGWLHARSGKSRPVGAAMPARDSSGHARIIIGLFAIGLFYAGALGFWVYLEQIGAEAGHSNALIGTILAWALAAGALGGMGPVWLGDRQGTAWPIIGSTLILIGTVLMAAGHITAPVFALTAIAFNGLWVFATAYQTALIATLDQYGGYVVLVPAAQGAGAMIGPATASLFVRSNDYAPVTVVAGSFFAVSLILFLVAMRGLGVSNEPR